MFEVWLEGEISNCKVWNTGHMYFTLKDGGAQIKAVTLRIVGCGTCASNRKTASTSSRADVLA